FRNEFVLATEHQANIKVSILPAIAECDYRILAVSLVETQTLSTSPLQAFKSRPLAGRIVRLLATPARRRHVGFNAGSGDQASAKLRCLAPSHIKLREANLSRLFAPINNFRG